MNFYSKHIGDFNNATRHLSRVERSLFSDAIELYYDTELPLTSDLLKLERLLLATKKEEKIALLSILTEFFVLNDDGYRNKRCDEELLKYHRYIEKQSRAGKASVQRRLNGGSTVVQPVFNQPLTINQVPLTINQLPIKSKTKTNTFQPLASLMSLQVSEQIARDWLVIRKAKKKPLTQTALNRVINQAQKGGYTLQAALTISCEEGWAGFNHAWKTNNSLNSDESPVAKVAWYSSEEATTSKGIEIGCLRLPKEDVGNYRVRIQEQLSGGINE